MKVTIAGEEFEFDPIRRSLADALAIEKAGGRRYAEWENEFFNGSAEAACVFVWFIWHREGRDVELKDLLAGKVDLDFSEVYSSAVMGYTRLLAEQQAAQENPTSGAGPRTGPDGTHTMPQSTRESSAKSSTSRHGTSGS